MAIIREKALFFTTSPRTPEKIIPEIRLLCECFEGQSWNRATQEAFTRQLAQSGFFGGRGSASDPAFSARDRINRAPKALGFVDLKPRISLTGAGRELVDGKRPQEAFLRQLLKFQLPSPYHKAQGTANGAFFIRPYLEILRLVRDLQYLTFDECKIFALRLIDYRRYEETVEQIRRFRAEIPPGSYRKFADQVWTEAVMSLYREDLAQGRTRTRETRDAAPETFLRTKKRNLRDYADACFRYLRYTGLVALSQRNRSLSILRGRDYEVNQILASVDREPVFITDEAAYKQYLFDPTLPVLPSDGRDSLIRTIRDIAPDDAEKLSALSVSNLKDLRDELLRRRMADAVAAQTEALKSYGLYQDILDAYQLISRRGYYDAPLMMEYNTWRAMTMLDGGEIRGNFKFDDAGEPLSVAAGNLPDMECDYGEFSLCVEVTLQSGQRQYESEGEPVARHYGKFREKSGKDAYCLFIAPSVNPAALAHFFVQNRTPVRYYGGKTRIIPLHLSQFVHLLQASRHSKEHPGPSDVRRFLDAALERCEAALDEVEWQEGIQACVEAWRPGGGAACKSP